MMLPLLLSLAAVAMAGTFRPTCNASLDVPGEGKIQVPPDAFQISCSVEVRNVYNISDPTTQDTERIMRETFDEASQNSARAYGWLKNQSKEDGKKIFNLRTTSVTLQPVNDYSTNVGQQPRVIGYIATNQMMFEVNLSAASEVIGQLPTHGVSRIDSVEPTLSRPLRLSARSDALRQAVKNAREEATVVLQATGVMVEPKIYGIEVVPAASVWPRFNQNLQLDSGGAQPAKTVPFTEMPTEAGTIDIVASVNIKYCFGAMGWMEDDEVANSRTY